MEFSVIANLFEELEVKKKRLDKVDLLKNFLLNNPKESPIIFDLICGNYQRKIEKRKIGISLKTIFSSLSTISSKNELEIEKKFNEIGDIGGVAQEVITQKRGSNLVKRKLSLKQIIETLDKISNTSGKNSNKRKREMVSELYYSISLPVEYKFLSRLLIDDLRVGVSEGTLREVCCCALFASIDGVEQTKKNLTKNIEKNEISIEEFIELDNKDNLVVKNSRETYNELLSIFEKKYNILVSFEEIIEELRKDKNNLFKYEIKLGKPFKSMLGPRSTSITDAFEKTLKPALLDFKYDGLRVQIHNNKGKVDLFTRNLDNITKQFPEIVEYIKTNFSDLSFVLDSECVGYDFEKRKFIPFQVFSKRILTKELRSVSHISVAVRTFDIVYLNGETIFKKPYKERREILESLFFNRKLVQKQKILDFSNRQ